MSDELFRRFRDKMQGRAAARRRGPAPPADAAPGETTPAAEAPVPDDSIRIRSVQHGPFPGAARYNSRFQEGVTRIRLTIDLGAELRRPHGPLSSSFKANLLALCPLLPEHDCRGGRDVHELLSAGDATTPQRARAPEEDGLVLAHLIEHVAIDLIVAVSGARFCSGVTCAWRDRTDRFDVFVECTDPLLGRSLAILATAAVRDLCAAGDGLEAHRRCRDLLTFLHRTGRKTLAPEDAATSLGLDLAATRESLEAVARLGYLEAVAAPLTFSSATGVLFRRVALEPGAGGPPALG
ncbi:MAG TPA: hypothetical protein VFT43_15575 [Candidatus Polarisedimenticolia bacterium]|nr:hypothetical protein [Candidatus Polarisedimenticolia bacterium]